MKIRVTSEIGKLKKVLIHSPDGGIGNVPTNKLHDWLYDDIVDVEKIQDEYAKFQALLILFLDTSLLFDDNNTFVLDSKNNFKSKIIANIKLFQNNPEKEDYFISKEKTEESKILDTQYLIQYLFEKYPDKAKMLIERICAIEGTHTFRTRDITNLIENNLEDGRNGFIEATKTLLTGKLEYQYKDGKTKKLDGDDVRFVFPPVPNFIFTRDIGVTIGDYLLVTKPRFYIRKREVILFRFIAENFLFSDTDNHFKIINVSEDDDFFQLEEKDQPQNKVTYEGGDIMMISDRHLLIGCSERTSYYAIQKLINRIFWENIKTNNNQEIDIISVIKISENRSQMHIDTILSHVREDFWILHSPLSEVWQDEQANKEWHTRSYINDLTQKSENEILKDNGVSIFQFYLNEDGKKIKRDYDKMADEKERKKLKSQFNKMNFLLNSKNGEKKYSNAYNCPYSDKPLGLEDLLSSISEKEFGHDKSKVKFVWSGGGEIPFDTREQWTDACNLLILKSGVAVGYDRNYLTAKAFNEKMLGDSKTEDDNFNTFVIEKNKKRFKHDNLYHILHIDDLMTYIDDNNLNAEDTSKLIGSIKNTLILLPSNELSRARGGSHCMSLPLLRENY